MRKSGYGIFVHVLIVSDGYPSGAEIPPAGGAQEPHHPARLLCLQVAKINSWPTTAPPLGLYNLAGTFAFLLIGFAFAAEPLHERLLPLERN
ncbi:Hypothetical predicted protein [Cloeon dipterum]|uniref:Uncharacterized protein n=1 Tax=Cloeon dipterum TaxID=197152 RepID=A0A8S1DSA1_9INSE|nr:Hypothetical predicted protein [Cloeon dipterum]